MTQENNNYDASSIQVLKGLEAVRMRPAMYIGDTDKRGLHHLVWEVLDNGCDEAMAGFCTHINVILHDNGETITLEDNGRGIPIDIHHEYKKEKKTALEVVLTVLHAGGKFDSKIIAGGLHGVGVSCVNALSDSLVAKVWRDGGIYEQSYSKGKPLTECLRVADSRKHGTSITFHADNEIFTKTVKFDEDILIRKFRETAFLNAGLKISYTNKKTGRTEEFEYSGGIQDYILYLTSSKENPYPAPPFYFKGKNGGNVEVQVSFQYTEDDDEVLLSFANNIPTIDGGTHLSGFKTALTRIANQFARSLGVLKSNDSNLTGDDIREGITTVISVRLPQPQFEGQTKARLGSVEAESAVNALFGEALVEYFEKNPAIAKEIIERAMVSQKAREAAKKQSDLIKRKSFLGKSHRLPGKLKDCDSENRAETELFICEGDSAAGAAKDGRNARNQAILPIRGKIINAEKNDIESLLKNTEIQALIAAIGTGIALKNEDEFDIENRRYDKIILMTDADVDGSHIAALLLTFFYRFMRPLVLEGHIYLAQPPLFKVDINKKLSYCWSKDEMTKFVNKYSNQKVRVTRFKGLGEMNADELAETTMDITSRRLVKVDVEDMGDVDKMLSTLMGRNVAPRKAYIIEHSKNRNREEE
jgi:DNA gyrase subunit B